MDAAGTVRVPITEYAQLLEAKRMPSYRIEGRDLIAPRVLYDALQGRPPAVVEEVDTHPDLFDYQRFIVRVACRKRRYAIFADCGLGKTPMQLEWAHQVCQHEQGNVLILAPLAVSQQTIREGEKFGIEVKYCRDQKDIRDGITITNYEMMEHFDTNWSGVVLDESSILKSYTGKFRTEIIERFIIAR